MGITIKEIVTGRKTFFITPDMSLFPESFLEDCMAVVVDSVDEVTEFFEEEGIDLDGADGDEILNASEVFDVGDGRYLIVEG